MGKNTKTMINVICSLLVLATNVLVSFFLSPYIVKNIGVEANGFVTLANNFVTYAQLIVTALNSMAARFIAIAYVRKQYKKANLYYNSVFLGNLIIVGVLIIPAIICIFKLENIINIPSNIIFDVKILFAFVFFNFFITTGLPNWDCGTFVTNRLDRSYIPQAISSILKCIVLFIAFSLFVPKVSYVGLAVTVMTVFQLICNAINTHKLTPELKVKIKPSNWLCSGKVIKKLVGAGIWNSISNVGNMLLSGLDLIICNVFLGATQMGIISLSKTIPNYMQQLSAAFRNAFTPEMTINYAQNNKEELLKGMHRAMKLTSIVMTIPIAIIIVLGKDFFSLWVPTQDASLLQVLSILSILGYMFTSGTQILYNVFPTVNKVKQNSIAMIITGIFSVSITILLIKTTNLGIYAVAGVSTFCNLVRNMTFTIIAASKYMGFKCGVFYKQVFETIISSIIIIVVGYLVTFKFMINSWFMFIIAAIMISIAGLIINVFIILNKDERKFLISKVKKKIGVKN